MEVVMNQAIETVRAARSSNKITDQEIREYLFLTFRAAWRWRLRRRPSHCRRDRDISRSAGNGDHDQSGEKSRRADEEALWSAVSFWLPQGLAPGQAVGPFWPAGSAFVDTAGAYPGKRQSVTGRGRLLPGTF